jgi:hypothetical protein
MSAVKASDAEVHDPGGDGRTVEGQRFARLVVAALVGLWLSGWDIAGPR